MTTPGRNGRIDWELVRERYAGHPSLASLGGSSRVRVEDVDDERICLSQRLWRDCISRDDLDAALVLLRDGRLPSSPMAFAEGLRSYYASGPRVETGCTRGPNLAAVVLTDLGYLTTP
ncbi:hypothetical protein GCM10023201_28250 [Actinomycetospora corticicola]|uniref:Uncharacterized protein n=1 Tax=Actinomycetospora corticicola TaxID=663602 RepID=A0A7Y9J695_9PSEU|nr:hypothetical protein [Actinomycetospora corticicola]NYD37042.1 hypothetical protein [Actinomycetospora corticicola]